MRVVTFDSESNGFVDKADKIWCIATVEKDGGTYDSKLYGPDELEWGLDHLSSAEKP